MAEDTGETRKTSSSLFWPREKRMLTESNRRLSRTSGWPRLLSIDAMRLKGKTSLS